MSKKWKNLIKKTTEFSFDPKLPRGRAIGRRRGTDDIQIGLPAWKKTIEYNKDKTKGKKYLQTEEEIVDEISNTIGHEYTHIATADEVIEARKSAFNEMVEALKIGNDPTKAIEKYVTVNVMDEMMSRVSHGEMQQEVYLNRAALGKYAPKNAKRLYGYMVDTGLFDDNKLNSFKQILNEVVPRKYKELVDKFKSKYNV